MSTLEEIRERLEGATEGPWEVTSVVDFDADGSYELAHVTAPNPSEPDAVQGIALGIIRDDAKFIAHAPADVAFLLDLVQRQRFALQRVELACDAMDAGTAIRSADPRTKSHAAGAIRAAIREAMGEE